MRITDAQRVLQIVGDLDRLLVEVRDPVLRKAGIGREQWQILRLLADGHGHAMGEVSEVFGLPGATATRLVDAMSQRMLVYRKNDPLDRRRVLLHLAEPGDELLQRVDDAIAEQADRLFDGLDPSERDTLADLLGRLTASENVRR